MLMKYPISLYQNLAIPHICSSEAAAQTLEFRAHAEKKDVPKQNNFGILQPLEDMLLRNCVLVRGQTLNDNLSYPKLYYHFI